MTKGNRTVHGYLLEFENSNILSALDQLEDYNPSRQKSKNLYNQEQVNIFTLQRKIRVRAWVYLMSKFRVDQLKGKPQVDGWWSAVSSTPPRDIDLLDVEFPL